MKVLEINGGVFGSTGKIMFGIAKMARKEGIEVLCVSPVTSTNRKKEPGEDYLKIGSYQSRRLSVLMSRITGYQGCFAYFSTRKMMKKIEEYNPDLIHLHNLHDSFIHIPTLMTYIKQNHKKVIWTLHDCWPFTGQCAYFTMADCEKWKTGCHHCAQYKAYPKSIYDNTKKMWKLKRKWFSGIDNMLIATPSQWLADLVRQSYLSDYPVEVINNGINTDVFRPTKSDFRARHGIGPDQFVVLGVAFVWERKKGLDVFIKLAEALDSSQFRIVLVGTTDAVDKSLPEGILSIHATQDQKELAAIYSAADLFVNPTREDNYPTVNMESIACGTPVLTFQTGGSPEIVSSKTGRVVPAEDVEGLVREILDIRQMKPFHCADLADAALDFREELRLGQYVQLYKKSLSCQI